MIFFFNDTATTEIYTLSLHDALPIYAYDVYRQTNPWAADAALSPKSVVREMWEQAFTFREFVNTYGLTRAEGAVLRHLSDAVKALRSGVPAAARTEEVTDFVEWLGEPIGREHV